MIMEQNLIETKILNFFMPLNQLKEMKRIEKNLVKVNIDMGGERKISRSCISPLHQHQTPNGICKKEPHVKHVIHHCYLQSI